MGDIADMLMDEALCGSYWEYDEEEEWEPRGVQRFFSTPYTLVHSTEKAYLVNIFNKNEWFPKSYCEVRGDKLIIPSWLAVRKGLPVHMMEML
jgi:hypothetical protein